MSRESYLSELDKNLCELPESEKSEVIQYYKDYFEDAGMEEESKIIDALGTPSELAKQIKLDLNNELNIECSERGFTNSCAVGSNEIIEQGDSKSDKNTNNNENEDSSKKTYKNNSTMSKLKDNFNNNKVLWIIIIVLSFPIWVPILTGLFGVGVGLLGGVVGILSGVYAVFISLIAVGLTFIVGGPLIIFAALTNGAFGASTLAVIIGISGIIFGLGILITIFSIWLIVKVTSLLWIAIKYIWMLSGKLWKEHKSRKVGDK